MADKKRLTEVSERLTEVSERLTEVGERLTEGSERLICASSELADGGDGVRFEVEWEGEATPAFAIRYAGRIYAYLNRCAHVRTELDWRPGKFFDSGAEYLICSTHGALYAPESGKCRGGPCRGGALVSIDVSEIDGKIYLKG